MNDILNQFRDLWQPLGVNQKISLILASGLVTLAMIAMMIWAAQPDMQLLYGNLSPEEAGEIVAKLEKQSIKFESGAGGNAIYVEADKVHKLRWELASDGMVPSGSGPGYELFDKGTFGVSDFVQRTNFLRAIQGELARTITQFNGVRSARVMVVMPENRIIVGNEGRDRATASVFVDTKGSIGLPAVNSIRHLVANAIQGLTANDVVVVDSVGVVLSEELQSDGMNGGLSNDALKYRKGLEVYFTNKVQTMLDRVMGVNKTEVRVAVDVDTSSLQTTETSFDPESQVVRSAVTEDNSKKEIENDGAGGAGTGVASNVPGAGGAAGAGSASNREETIKVRTEQYEISEMVSNRVQNPGSIRRLTASLLVAKRYKEEDGAAVWDKREADEISSLRQIVINALGIELRDGQQAEDVVTVNEMDFAVDPLANQGEILERDVNLQYWLDVGKNGVGVILGLGVIIFFLQMMKRNQPEAISVEVLQPEQMLQGRKMEDTSSVTPEMLNELIRQKPANIGVTLREWIGETEGANK